MLAAGGWVAGAAVLRVAVVSPEQCPAISGAEARAAAESAAQWIVRNQAPDGTYVYEYSRESNVFTADYNVVRHAGVTMSLYQYAAAGHLEVLPSADAGLEYMRDNLVREGDRAAFAPPGERVSLGSTALMLAGLAQRRAATNESRHDGLMRDLARFLVGQQRADGSMLAFWDRETRAPVPELTSKYTTGEAYWALALVHNLFPGEGWDRPTRLTADYLSNHRDRVEKNTFPPWADQWAAYGLAEMAHWPLNDDNIRYARDLAARFGFLVRVESRKDDTQVSKLMHGREARAGGLGTWVEALSSLSKLAAADSRLAVLREDIDARAACSAGILAERQFSADDAEGEAQPGLVEGAWFIEGATRMDDQQHALSGLLYTAPILDRRGRR